MELVAQNIQKTFRGSDSKPSFRLDISEIRLSLGSNTFVMGLNGSGKSVFARLLAGDLMPDRGSVVLKINDKSWTAHSRGTPIVRQRAEDNLALDLTVRENLTIRAWELSYLRRLMPQKKIYSDDLLLNTPELAKKSHEVCRSLSGGQKQTLAVIAATCRREPLLILDEFLASTDRNTSVLLRKMVAEYAASVPAVVLIVSHDVNEAITNGHRIIVLKEGRLAADVQRGSDMWTTNYIEQLLSHPHINSF